ncbi:MAG TPA: fibronectin type III domain-containing protein, partial [Micromonosporaceae bacterium]|nr:fibronectin type III domain-containing protein [Micromonosporaceae bacterium]
MDRRRLHRIAIAGAGLVLIGGAVVLLRDPDSGVSEQLPAPLPTLQTSVRPFADESVIVPQRGDPPAAPARLDVRPASHRLVIGWGPGRVGAPEPAGAAGYEVRWGPGRRPNHTRFVAEPVIQLDGLDNDAQYQLEVRTVDSFGQRSEPARTTGTPTPGLADPTPFAFVDRFDGHVVPDPQRWAVVGIGNCTKATRGAGEDSRRMMITGGCGDSDEAVALRSRTPIRLLDPASAPNGELGRFVVQTDRPGLTGQLTLDLVPGPVDLIGRPPRPGDGMAGQTLVDDSLPPGTIRTVITGHRAAEGGTTVRVAVAPGTPLPGREIPVNPTPPAEPGVS